MVNSNSVSLVVNAAGPPPTPAVTSIVPNPVNGAASAPVNVTIMFSGIPDGTSLQIQGLNPSDPNAWIAYNVTVGVNESPSGGAIIQVDATWVGVTSIKIWQSPGGVLIPSVPFVVNA